MPFDLASATKMANRIAAELLPFCDKFNIAGSIRRLRPFVNDVDIVVLPAPGKENALRARVKEKCKRVVTDAPMTLVVVLQNNLQVDVWIAQPETKDLLDTRPTNFGSLLLCRTGSAAHNIYLVEHAKKLGLVWNPYHGVFAPRGHSLAHRMGEGRGEGHSSICLASATEEEIFAALQLDYIPPEKRER